MKNNKNDELPEYVFSGNILIEEDPLELLTAINKGEISRYSCWKILQLIHAGEISCGLPQYGILTVFSLAKDFKQFTELFEQGCDMLRNEGVLSQKAEEEAFKRLSTMLNKKIVDTTNPIAIPLIKKKSKKKNNKKKN